MTFFLSLRKYQNHPQIMLIARIELGYRTVNWELSLLKLHSEINEKNVFPDQNDSSCRENQRRCTYKDCGEGSECSLLPFKITYHLCKLKLDATHKYTSFTTSCGCVSEMRWVNIERNINFCPWVFQSWNMLKGWYFLYLVSSERVQVCDMFMWYKYAV